MKRSIFKIVMFFLLLVFSESFVLQAQTEDGSQRISMNISRIENLNLIHINFEPDDSYYSLESDVGRYDILFEFDFLDDDDVVVFSYPDYLFELYRYDNGSDPVAHTNGWISTNLKYDLYISPPCNIDHSSISNLRITGTISRASGVKGCDVDVYSNSEIVGDIYFELAADGIRIELSNLVPVNFDSQVPLGHFVDNLTKVQCEAKDFCTGICPDYEFYRVIPYGGCPEYDGSLDFPYYNINVYEAGTTIPLLEPELTYDQKQDVYSSYLINNGANTFTYEYPYTYWNDGGLFDVEITDGSSSYFSSNNSTNLSTPSTFDFDDPDNTGNFFINSDHKIDGLLKVHYNQTVVVNGATLEFMDEHSGIIVERGGTLILDNATLSGKECDDIGYTWRGVQVKGDMNTPHPIDPMNNMHPHHGLLYARNSSKIKDAKDAIHVIDLVNLDDISDIDTDTNPDVDHGGGIIKLDGVLFEDNKTSLKMYQTNFQNGNNENMITNCDFLNTFAFNSSNGNPRISNQVILIGVENLKITGCKFKSDAVSGKYFIGIQTTNSQVTIGNPDDASLRNEFDRLSKGIVVYETGGFDVPMHIFNNTFNYIDKSITLNTTKHTIIEDNEFLMLGGSSTQDAYGIMAYESSGFEITSNTFKTQNGPNNQRGIVVVNTFDTSNGMAEINANRFEGTASNKGFISGIEIDGDNRGLQMRCNNFDGNSKHNADWRFVNNARLDVQGTDPSMGSQDGSLYFNNTWGATSTNHIYFDSVSPNQNSEITLYADIQASLPTKIAGMGGDLSTDSQVKGKEFPCEDTYDLPLEDYDPPAPTYCRTDGESIRNLHRMNSINMVETNLLCVAADSDVMSLTVTYAHDGQFFLAREQLDKLPLDTEENIEFYATYDALITALENDGSAGKTAMALYKIKEKAGKPDPIARKGKMASYSESILALLEGKSYERSAVPIAKTSIYPSITNESVLSFNPNPAKNTLYLDVNESGLLKIYDLNGKLLLTHSIEDSNFVDVSKLADGFYICEFTAEKTGLAKSSKLLINR